MLHSIVLLIGLLAVVNSSPLAEMQVSKIMSMLKQAQAKGEFNILSALAQANQPEHTTDNGELYDLIRKEYNLYKEKYNKVYKTLEERESHLAAFLVNMATVLDHNEEFKKGKKEYTMGVNHMSDWTYEEIKKLNGYQKSAINGSSYIPLSLGSVKLPSEIDWREKGAVTPVKDQGLCGSCYSFASTGSLEAQIWRKTGKLISLSEQQIVDCDHGDNGCHGGSMQETLSYIKKVGGLMTEKAYPYNSGTTQQPNDKCSFDKSKTKATDTGFVQIPQDETKIQEAVATTGPVAVAIVALPELVSYHSGIYYNKECTNYLLNHAVLIVGYGTDKDTGTPYWIIKNSWGKTWGENGYFRMPRNVNACGISSDGVYPLI